MGGVTGVSFIIYYANYVSLFAMELKKLLVNDNIRASYEANKLCFPSIIWNVTNNTKLQKWQFLRNVLAALTP